MSGSVRQRTGEPGGKFPVLLNNDASAARQLVGALRSTKLLYERGCLLRRHQLTHLPVLTIGGLA